MRFFFAACVYSITMCMEIMPMLSTPFYRFSAPEELVSAAQAHCEAADLHGDSYRDASDGDITRDQFTHRPLLLWFEQCLESVRARHYGDWVRLRVVTCWANHNRPMTNIGLHTHCNSLVSGVFYLTDEDRSSTEFHTPDPYLLWSHWNFMSVGPDPNGGSDDPRLWLKDRVQPRRGDLIVFPSTLRHRTLTHRGPGTRYSVAFNAWPEISVNLDNPTCRLIQGPKALLD